MQPERTLEVCLNRILAEQRACLDSMRDESLSPAERDGAKRGLEDWVAEEALTRLEDSEC